MLIYVVEDDNSILKLIDYSLKSKGFETVCFENGREFFTMISKKVPDLVLLDIMLPDVDGIEILKRIKQNPATSDIWVMMITAKSSEYDVISALDLGADDYIKKPFSVMELLSRVNAITRRVNTRQKDEDLLKFNEIEIDNLKRIITIDGNIIDFTYKEYELLKYLILNKEIVVSREKLLASIWGYDYEGETRTVDMHIKLLRDKLKDKRKYIKTVRGVGYMLTSKV